MALWNQKYLSAPPTNTYKSNTNDLDIVKLKNALQECMKHFKNEDFMIRETALLSRILYRMKMKFRSSKEFKSLEKINHSMNIYLNTNMGRDLRNIFDLIPSKYQKAPYLPTRNMLSYILVRIQGLVKLMERVYDTCHVAAYEIHNRISIGHFWKIYIVLFALVSRIYVLVKFNTKLLCELYGKLLPHSNKMENPGRNWLPEGYELPGDLREWLGVKWVYEEEFIDLTRDLTLQPSMKILDFFNLVDDDDDDEVQFCDEYILIDKEDINIAKDFKNLKPIEETFTRNRMRGFSINEDDIGEDIAEIIELNETIKAKLDLSHTGHNKDMESHLSHEDKRFDAEDIGEDISSNANDRDNLIQIINLDETNFPENTDGMMEFTKVTRDLFQSPKNTRFKKKNTKTPKNKIKNNKNDTVINLLDDSEVIVIPETPAKESQDTVIILNDTIANNSVNLLDLTRRVKRKRKSRKISKAMANASSINDNFTGNVTDKNNESIYSPISSTSNENVLKQLKEKLGQRNLTNVINEGREVLSSSRNNITKSLNDSNNIMPQTPSRKKEIQQKTTKQLDKIKIDASKDFTPENNKAARKRKRKHKEMNPSSKNITESVDDSIPQIPSTKKKLKMEKRRIKQLNDKMNRSESSNFTAESNNAAKKRRREVGAIMSSSKNIIESLHDSHNVTPQHSLIQQEIKTQERTLKQLNRKRKLGNIITNKKDKTKKKIKFDINDSEISPISRAKRKRNKKKKVPVSEKHDTPLVPNWEKQKPNIVCLTLVDEKTSGKHEKQDSAAPTGSAKNTFNMNLIPRLERPLKGTLNIDTLIKNDKASPSKVTPDHKTYATSHELSENTDSRKEVIEKSLSKMSKEKSQDKELEQKKTKKKVSSVSKNKSSRKTTYKKRREMAKFKDFQKPNADDRNLEDSANMWQPFKNETESKFFRNDEELRRSASLMRMERLPKKKNYR